MFFDDNSISIDGSTNLSTSDDIKKRFESYNWNYIKIDGHNFDEINASIVEAKKSLVPTIIACKTKIGYGSPNKSGKSSSHGSPLGKDEIDLVRKKLNWHHKAFEIPDNLKDKLPEKVTPEGPPPETPDDAIVVEAAMRKEKQPFKKRLAIEKASRETI